ncbi:prephenate dehydratase [Candidatus Desulforudis audaxviator]|uniref:Prephenate dehydratase n=1 Tax=Desulforudis audaxviator (strain MP104C) TaxID=477974 RepID=B1I5U9_DESAP|nr:prephenate dehydratase [Candidatus Desulforudis audaxviator]ACA60397.1 Prephenate dehydratase [Candidatus Desulforudis audaxviator MP104C]AZK60452.1 Prephenate dehydratase [Candidatus Desulforudis audaxviator]
METIAYLGPEGTHSEEAASRWAGDRPMLLRPLRSLVEVVGAVEGGSVDWGLLPAENSGEGSLGLTLDLLAHQADRVQICGEVVLRIRHHLLARPGVSRERVTRIISHSQALAQCREHLARDFPGVELVESTSTAEAARAVAQTGRPWAAVGTRKAARLHGLSVLAEDVADLKENATRFLVIGRRGCRTGPGDKTTVLVAVDGRRPGSLYRLLGEFARRGINLTRIESRPAKTRLGEYIFFIDLEGHPGEPEVDEALAGVRARSSFCKILGSYPADGASQTPRDPVSSDLETIRAEIDVTDSQIVALLAERAELARRAGKFKDGRPVRDPEREAEIKERLRALAVRKGLDADIVTGVYELLLPYFVELQGGPG